MLSKLLLYGTIAGSFFAISAFSTIQITKQINKTPVPNETEEEDDEDIYVRQMSDTERFINNLTAFGNMEGNLNASIKKGDYTLSINGDVFVSMETMEDIQFDASLAVTTLGHTFDIKATYLNGTVYVTLEGNNLKLETSSIGEITSLFSTMESSIEFPEAFKNIDTNQLISNLSAMEAVKGENDITYTCNLIEGIPPIIFKSDLDYKMTGVSISNCEIEGFKIDVNATTNILGKGNNRIVNPESEANPYTNITSYFGVMRQINNLINSKEANLDYSLSLAKAGSNLISTSGTASVSLKEGLDLVVDGTLYNSDKSKNVTYLAGYQNNNVIVNFNDLIKVYYDTEHFDDLKSSISSLLANEDIAKLMDNLESVELPLINAIKNKDYNGLINQYHGLFLSKDQIRLTLSNSLFSNNNTDFVITVNLNESGITDVNISNLRYNDYALSLSVAIKEYNKTTIDLTDYDNVSNVDKIINQVNDLISSKKFNLNLTNISYGDYTVTGYVQLDIENNLYQADVNIQKATTVEEITTYTNYRVRFENDGTNYYLAYSDDKVTNSDVKIVISESSINDTIVSIKNFFNGEETELKTLVNSLLDTVKEKLSSSATETSITDIIFEDYLSSFDITKDVNDNEVLNVVINGSKLGLDSDITINVGLDENTHISTISGNLALNNENAVFNVKLNDFDANLHAISLEERPETIKEGNANEGGWVGASNVTKAITYVTELDATTQNAVVNQIKEIVENKEARIGYDINVYKGANILVFNIAGDVDVSIDKEDLVSNSKVNFHGDMTNPEESKKLDSDIDIKLYNGTVYFDYKTSNDTNLKFAYSINDIKDLVNIIKGKVNNNSTVDVSGLLNSLFPSNSSTTSSPIVNIVKDGNYLSIINYYKNTYIEGNTLNLVFDGALIGNPGVDIVLSVGTNNNGISKISINGVYALGYTLNCDLYISDYVDYEMSEEQINEYTNLKYINNMFDEIYELVQQKEFAITLSGTMNLGKGELTINGDSKVYLSDENDIGLAHLTIETEEGKTHTIDLDVNRLKDENGNTLPDSKVAFEYNSNLKGTIDLSSVNNIFNTIKQLASDGNPLLDKIKGLLSRDSTQSTLSKVMNGEPEAVLYDNVLETITHHVNDDKSQYYDIKLSGNLFKKDTDDIVSPIHIYINMDENGNFTGVSLNGNINGYSMDINLGITKETSNPSSWKRINSTGYMNFSSLEHLTEYLFNTATKKDFSMSGTAHLYASILVDFNLGNLGLDAKVHIDEDTGETFAKVVISNIPDTIVSDGDWDERTFTMYFTDEEVYLHVYTYEDHWFTADEYHNKWIRLTFKQFADDLAYYLVNYGLGITTDGALIGDALDMRNQSSSSHEIDYSKILSSYTYNSGTNPSWTLGLNLNELTGTTMFEPLSATITGNSETKLLSSISANTTIISIVHADFNASLTSTDFIGQSNLDSITSYIEAHSNDTYMKSYSD